MSDTYRDDLRDLAIAAARVCELLFDHSGPQRDLVDAAWVLGAAETLRVVARRIADPRGSRPRRALCRPSSGDRSSQRRGGLRRNFDGAAAARDASTWRELQLVQYEHDRAYHPDWRPGLHKSEQLVPLCAARREACWCHCQRALRSGGARGLHRAHVCPTCCSSASSSRPSWAKSCPRRPCIRTTSHRLLQQRSLSAHGYSGVLSRVGQVA